MNYRTGELPYCRTLLVFPAVPPYNRTVEQPKALYV
jgi:hypothetical protein